MQSKIYNLQFTIVLLFIVSALIAQPNTDTIQPTPSTKLKYYSKSSGLAMLLSAVIPGGGQFYTENYLKGILFVGAEGALAYYAYQNHKDYQETGNLNSRNRRNNLLWWIASVKLLSLADAYVSANMYKFKDMMRLSFDAQKDQISFGVKSKL